MLDTYVVILIGLTSFRVSFCCWAQKSALPQGDLKLGPLEPSGAVVRATEIVVSAKHRCSHYGDGGQVCATQVGGIL